jgi:hypothetical protein
MMQPRFALFLVIVLATVSCRTAGSTRAQQKTNDLGNADPAFARLLGGYDIAPHNGWVRLQDLRKELMVQVGVERVEGREIKVEDFSTWVLLANGKALSFERKFPTNGEPMMGYKWSGTSVGIIPFWFTWGHRERPVAVVLKLKDQYKTFPVPPRDEDVPSTCSH